MALNVAAIEFLLVTTYRITGILAVPLILVALVGVIRYTIADSRESETFISECSIGLLAQFTIAVLLFNNIYSQSLKFLGDFMAFWWPTPIALRYGYVCRWGWADLIESTWNMFIRVVFCSRFIFAVYETLYGVSPTPEGPAKVSN